MPQTPKQILVEWAASKHFNAVHLARITGYQYAHCWDLLRGKRSPTRDIVSRLLAANYLSIAKRLADVIEAEAESQLEIA